MPDDETFWILAFGITAGMLLGSMILNERVLRLNRSLIRRLKATQERTDTNARD